MEIKATVIVEKILHVDGPSNGEGAVDLIRKMIEGGSCSLSTFQKWEPGNARLSPAPCEKLIHIVDMKPND